MSTHEGESGNVTLIDTNAPTVICVSGGKDSHLVVEQEVSYAVSVLIVNEIRTIVSEINSQSY